MITGTLNQESVHVGIWQSQPGKSEESPFQTSEGCCCVEFLIREMSTALDKLSALLQNSSFIVAGFTASSWDWVGLLGYNGNWKKKTNQGGWKSPRVTKVQGLSGVLNNKRTSRRAGKKDETQPNGTPEFCAAVPALPPPLIKSHSSHRGDICPVTDQHRVPLGAWLTAPSKQSTTDARMEMPEGCVTDSWETMWGHLGLHICRARGGYWEVRPDRNSLSSLSISPVSPSFSTALYRLSSPKVLFQIDHWNTLQIDSIRVHSKHTVRSEREKMKLWIFEGAFWEELGVIGEGRLQKAPAASWALFCPVCCNQSLFICRVKQFRVIWSPQVYMKCTCIKQVYTEHIYHT